MSSRKGAKRREQSRQYKCLDCIIAFFISILIVSNIASSAKIVDLGFSLWGIPMAFDGGTLLFPIAYVLGDILTEVYGFAVSRRVIWIGFGALALCSGLFFLLRALPGDPSWEAYAGSAAFDAILGGISRGGIALASLVGYLAGSITNAAIHSRLKVLMQGKRLWVRTMASSLVGELLDTLAFVGIATLTGVFGWELFASLVLTNYLFKICIEASVTPITYLASAALKKAEALDVYDR